MITMQSTLREVYRNPVGKDILLFLLQRANKSHKLLNNPLVGSLKLSSIDRLIGKKVPGLAAGIVRILQNHPHQAPEFPSAINPKWWKEAVVYQIYPRSFMDSNDDGIGDLAGIKSQIPYLKDLGVDVVWLSPIYDSPCDDNGYDVRNYKKILQEFGSMASFKFLVKALHEAGIKLMMDLVINHTSDEHEWFQKALADPTCPEKDYYIWANGQNGNPPNNWQSFFSGSAWNQYSQTEEWALHIFSKKQMDLNWNNPSLRYEVYDIVRWWLDKGVDGFRLDVINFISKDSLQDGNSAIGDAFGYCGIEHYFYGPDLHHHLQEMNREAFSVKEDVFTVGETPGIGLNMSRMLSAEERSELSMVFNFDHLDNPGQSRMFPYDYDLRHLKPYFLHWQQNYGNNCWQALFFENHDNPRMISKIQSDVAWRMVLAKLLAVLQFTLRGTPFIYQGQELGMTNTQFSSIDDLRDVEAKNRFEKLKILYSEADSTGEQIALETVAWGTRDHSRTPMQWTSDRHAGFTKGEPWMPPNPNYPTINAENEVANPNSVYHFFKKMIALRREHTALIYGDFSPVFVNQKNTFCYFRTLGNSKLYIEINLSEETQKRPGPLSAHHHLIASNYGGVSSNLRAYEANVYSIF